MGMSHGGDIYRCPVSIDFSINVNPLGMPENVKEALIASVDRWAVYPDTECGVLRERLSGYLNVPKKNILCGNGAAELLYDLVRVLRPRRALLPAPTFTEYEAALKTVGCEIRYFPLHEERGFALCPEEYAEVVEEGTDLVFLCNPNNPNGLAVTGEEVMLLAGVCKKKGARLVVDECFVELLAPDKTASGCAGSEHSSERCSVVPFCGGHPELIVLRAFTKSQALAGLRLGFLISGDTALLAALRAVRQPWSVSVPAQIAGAAALAGSAAYLKETRRVIAIGRKQLREGLKAPGFTVYPSDASFLLFSCGLPDLKAGCLRQGILIRDCSDYVGLPADRYFYRVCVRTETENAALLAALTACVSRPSGQGSGGCSGIPR